MKKGILICLALMMVFHIAPAQKQKKKKKNTQTTQTQKQTMVDITTDYGVIRIKLYDETPKHRDNFIKLVKEGTLNGTLFHRVIGGFMIQGGDPDSKTAKPGQVLGNGDVGYTIPAEFNPALYHKKGALAAARTSNPAKASSGCQFYIVQGRPISEGELMSSSVKYTDEQREVYKTIGGTAQLDMNYTVFGEVVSGIEVVDKIAAVEKDRNDRPATDIKMTLKLVE